MTIERVELYGGPRHGAVLATALPLLVDELAIGTGDVPARYRRTGECVQLRGIGQPPYSRHWTYVWTPDARTGRAL